MDRPVGRVGCHGVFTLFTQWLPELFPTAHRSFGAGFAFSLGRILGAVGPTQVGAFVVITGSYPWAIPSVSVIYLLGLPAIAVAPETAGKARRRDFRQSIF